MNHFNVEVDILMRKFHANLELREQVGSWDMNLGIISEMETIIRVESAGSFVGGVYA